MSQWRKEGGRGGGGSRWRDQSGGSGSRWRDQSGGSGMPGRERQGRGGGRGGRGRGGGRGGRGGGPSRPEKTRDQLINEKKERRISMAPPSVRHIDGLMFDAVDDDRYNCRWSVPAGDATDDDIAEMHAVWSIGGRMKVEREGDEIVATAVYAGGGNGAMARILGAVYDVEDKYNAKWEVAHAVNVDQPPATTAEECERFCREEMVYDPRVECSYDPETRSICLVDTKSISCSARKVRRARAEWFEYELAWLRGVEACATSGDLADAADVCKRLMIDAEDKVSRWSDQTDFTDEDITKMEQQVAVLRSRS
jgi:hypothetical protein